jgi:spore maturation protein CgeB
MPRPRILFVAGFTPGENSTAHFRVLRELGCDVEVVNSRPYMTRGGRISAWLRFRTLAGPTISTLNEEILEVAERFQPHLLWAEKPIGVRPGTFQKLRDRGIVLSCLTYDNPFGDMGEPLWRLFRRSLPLFDLHVVPRRVSESDFIKAGARRVLRINFAFDPARQFPPPPGWTDADRTIDVSFTGAPHDNRAAKLLELRHDHGITVDVRGDRWERVLGANDMATLVTGPGVWGEDYQKRFWQSRLCLAFITHANHDDTAHRCFEIAASKGFMLAERTDTLLDYFTEDHEAVYFSDMAECAEKIRRFLPDIAERERIASNARARAIASGYGMPDQFARVIRDLRSRHYSIPEPDNLPPEISPPDSAA